MWLIRKKSIMFACECWTFSCMKMCGWTTYRLHTGQTSAAPPLTLTFSLVLSSSNISWISTRQSSCMLWKESWGMVAITASSMADSCSRMQGKDGRTWGSWSQHSGDTWEHEPSLTDWPNQTFTLASVWLYPPWAWQKVQGRWRGLVGLIYWQPHRKLQPDRLYHDTAPPQLATPIAGHHSWRVEWNGKRETGNNTF